MLTLDTEKLERQKRITRFREDQNRNRERLLDALEKKTVTVASDGDICTTRLEQQLGMPMSSPDFIKRVQRMNRSLMFEPSIADSTKTGIYVVQSKDGIPEKVFVCGMERGFMPERTVRHAKKEMVPDTDPMNKGGFVEIETFTKETRGWRTVLMRLLRRRLITQPQIDRYFPENLNSRNWQVLTT